MAYLFKSISRIPIPSTENSCLWSQRLNSRASATISKNRVAVFGANVYQRRTSCINTFKVKAVGSEETERRFPPQDQDGQPGKEYRMDPLPIFSDPNYKPSNKLKGKVALVTGGDSGIGRSVCYFYAKEGATVAFTYVKGVEDIDAKNTLKIINDAKVREAGAPIAIPTDLRYDKNCKKVVDEVVAKYGRIDVLVNNAAIQYNTYTLDDITEERLERIFRTNIFSYFFVTRSFSPLGVGRLLLGRLFGFWGRFPPLCAVALVAAWVSEPFYPQGGGRSLLPSR